MIYQFKSLKSKLIFWFVLLSLIPIIGFSTLSYIEGLSLVREQTGEYLQSQSEAIIDKIDRNLFERYGDVQAFAAHSKALGNAHEATEIANLYTKLYGIYDLMIISDLDGTIVAANTTSWDGQTLDTSTLLGRDISNENWFKEISTGKIKKGETYYSDPIFDEMVIGLTKQRDLSLIFSTPIYDSSGKLVRIWTNFASWRRIVSDIMDSAVKDFRSKGMSTIESHVLDKHGLLLYDYDPTSILKINLADKGIKAAVGIVEAKSGYTEEMHARKKIMQINGYATSKGALGFKGYGWGVMLRQATEEAYIKSKQVRNFMLICGAVGTLFVIAIAWWIASGISKPLSLTAKIVKGIAAGKLRHTIDINSKDEVGQMAQALTQALEGIRGAVQADEVDWLEVGRQKELEKEMHRISAMVENATSCILAVSTDLKVIYANPASKKAYESIRNKLGLSGRDIIGLPAQTLFRTEEDHAVLKDPRKMPHHTTVEFNGEYLEIQVNAIYDKSNQYIGPMLSWSIVTEKIESEKRIKEAKERETLAAAEKAAEKERQAERERAQALAEREQAAALQRKVNIILEAVNAAANGDLTKEITVKGSDAIGQIGAGLETFLSKLRDSMVKIAKNSGFLANSSRSLDKVSGQMNVSAEETSTQAEVVSSAAEQISKSIQTVATSVEEMNSSINEIARSSSEAATVTGKAVEITNETKRTMNELGEGSQEIGKIVKLINSIAEQTNLLALNATIEAARAGEAGKGFAVVANEVKELAKETTRATEEISAKVGIIQNSSNAAIAAIEQTTEVVTRISDISQQIASAIEEQSVTTREISKNITEVARGGTEIAENITKVAQAAQQTSTGASETQSASTELTSVAKDLGELVSQFKIESSQSA